MASTKTYAEDTFTTTTQDLFIADFTSVKVEAGAYIQPTASVNGITLEPGVWTVTLNGGILALGNGISLLDGNSAKNSKVTIGTEGSLYGVGSGADGLRSAQGVDITNAGDIVGARDGIHLSGVSNGSKGFTITNTATGTITGDTTAAINDGFDDMTMTVKNAGTIGGNSTAISILAFGAINVTNTGFIFDAVTINDASATFANTITNSGDMDNLFLDNGNDTVKNTGTIFGSVNLFDGNNSVTNAGFIEFSVETSGGGANKITNSGTINDDVSLGTGADTVKNSGDIFGDVSLSSGTNSFTNSGHITGAVSFGGNADTGTNSGIIDGDIDLLNGINKFTNAGILGGALKGGAQADTVTSTGTITGPIDLGGGDDVFSGGKGDDDVLDTTGSDSIKLGGGDDTFEVSGDGAYTLDGGTGFDVLDLSSYSGPSSYYLNLGASAVTIGGAFLPANYGTTGFADGGSIKGIEAVLGTDSVDFIAGGAVAETLSGGKGADTLSGGLGADTLTGGADADTFVYLSAKDSGVTKAGMDKILDFHDGTDRIDLHLIDTDTTSKNTDEAFHFIGTNTEFTKHTGDLRAVSVGLDTVVQGDVNGDGKADFAILLVGITSGIDGNNFDL